VGIALIGVIANLLPMSANSAPESGYPPTFIVSTGRCGSTLASRLMRMHPDILSISEFFMSLASRAFVKKALDGEELWKLLTVAHAGEKLVFNPEALVDEFLYPYNENSAFNRDNLPPLLFVTLPHLTDDHDALFFELEPILRARPKAPVGEQFAFLFNWLRVRLNKKMWVERSGASLTFLPVLKDIYPDARFVHVYRDGRDVAMSTVNHSPTRLYAHAWKTAKRVGINPLKRPFLLAETPIVPMFEWAAVKLMGLEKKLNTPLPPQETGAFWSDMVKIGLQNLADIPEERLMSLRYEDLVVNPQSELSRLISFMGPGLEDDAWMAEASALPRYREPAWKQLPETEQAALNAACAEGLELLGYDI
jgi:hypothetical protein